MIKHEDNFSTKSKKQSKRRYQPFKQITPSFRKENNFYRIC